VPQCDKACVVTVVKLEEKDKEKSDIVKSPSKSTQHVQSAATSSVLENTKTVVNMPQTASTARSFGSMTNNDSEVEILDDSDTDSFDIHDETYWLPSTKHVKRPGAKKPWSSLEEEMVYKGVKAHGVGNWAVIRSNFLRHRSNIDIKDKWRTMIRQGRLHEMARQFGPLS